eukprot:PhM_4_TR12461/c0_g1_i1/m.55756
MQCGHPPFESRNGRSSAAAESASPCSPPCENNNNNNNNNCHCRTRLCSVIIDEEDSSSSQQSTTYSVLRRRRTAKQERSEGDDDNDDDDDAAGNSRKLRKKERDVTPSDSSASNCLSLIVPLLFGTRRLDVPSAMGETTVSFARRVEEETGVEVTRQVLLCGGKELKLSSNVFMWQYAPFNVEARRFVVLVTRV